MTDQGNAGPQQQSNPFHHQTKKSGSTGPMAKIAMIGAITLALLIPLMLISSMVEERRERYDQTREEITSKWGGQVTVKGPIVAVPYENVVTLATGETRRQKHINYILPDRLSITGQVKVETRKRGIYVKNVYSSNLSIDGALPPPTKALFDDHTRHIFWDQARLLVRVPNQREVVGNVTAKIGRHEIPFTPQKSFDGISMFVLVSQPFHYHKLATKGGKQIPIQIQLPIRGADHLNFSPLARHMQVSLHGNWPDPSFGGATLPSSSYINEKGFDVEWVDSSDDHGLNQVSSLTPSSFNSPGDYMSFGVSLYTAVDHYHRVNRVLKYAILFVILTFVAFFMFEILCDLRLHPIQYILVGCALVLFYLLLLSMTEHIAFKVSYTFATMAVVALIGAYTRSILKLAKRAVIISCGLVSLYSYLYFLLILEQYSLLFGSFGMFAILAMIMFFTRNIDWYNIGHKPQTDSLSAPIEA